MISFLTSPKPFTGHTGIIQRNAIRSWQAVHPEAEVIIYGDGEGVAEACQELGVNHVPQIACSPSGIPFFNAIVEHASTHSRHDIQCYLNCDILMTEKLISGIRAVKLSQYLLVGQRIDLAEEVELDVTSCDWKVALHHLISRNKACLHAPTGMDYFIFPRGIWQGLPPLIVGRGGYDNALLAFCFRNNIPLINSTLAFPVFHQFHDYGHVAGGNKTVVYGKDARDNLLLHDIKHSLLDSADAQWLIIKNVMVPNWPQKDRLRKIELKLRFDVNNEPLSLLIRALWRLAVALRVIKQKSFTLKEVIGLTLNE